MAKFLVLYSGGKMADTPEEQQKSMQAWQDWFGAMGDALIDSGNPLSGKAMTVTSSGATDGSSMMTNGYSMIQADSLEAASGMMDGCPVFEEGGSASVFEVMEMM